MSISDSWLRNVYLIHSLSRGTVVILFLGNICLYFLRTITQGSQWRNLASLEIDWRYKIPVMALNKYWQFFCELISDLEILLMTKFIRAAHANLMKAKHIYLWETIFQQCPGSKTDLCVSLSQLSVKETGHKLEKFFEWIYMLGFILCYT